jgi:hypothetical protein
MSSRIHPTERLAASGSEDRSGTNSLIGILHRRHAGQALPARKKIPAVTVVRNLIDREIASAGGARQRNHDDCRPMAGQSLARCWFEEANRQPDENQRAADKRPPCGQVAPRQVDPDGDQQRL